MGGVSSRDHPLTTAEDRRPGAHHCAKDLDPLYEGLPLEERFRLRLGGSALLKGKLPRQKPRHSLEQRGAVRLKHPGRMNPSYPPCRKESTENLKEEK